jgi:hypothetical protein
MRSRSARPALSRLSAETGIKGLSPYTSLSLPNDDVRSPAASHQPQGLPTSNGLAQDRGPCLRCRKTPPQTPIQLGGTSHWPIVTHDHRPACIGCPTLDTRSRPHAECCRRVRPALTRHDLRTEIARPKLLPRSRLSTVETYPYTCRNRWLTRTPLILDPDGRNTSDEPAKPAT